MKKWAYYNDVDPAACAVTRELIKRGIVCDGEVDQRSIAEVMPEDVAPFVQAHFFCGGSLWSVAARLAGWPDDSPLWTGSCPCQPFSNAGKGLGTDDPRHLWPHFHRLICAGRPPVVMGEQVASKAGRHWFHGVRSDLEAGGYAGRAVDFPACSVDAPHQRNRLYWIAVNMADRVGSEGGRRRPDNTRCPAATSKGEDRTHTWAEPTHVDGGCRQVVNAPSERRGEGWPEHEVRSGRPTPTGADASGHMDVTDKLDRRAGAGRQDRPQAFDAAGTGVTLGDAFSPRLEGHTGYGDGSRRPESYRSVAEADGCECGLPSDAPVSLLQGQPSAGNEPDAGEDEGVYADAAGAGWDAASQAGIYRQAQGQRPWHVEPQRSSRPERPNRTYWSDAEWIVCHDEKARRAKSGLCFLVDGLSGRVDLWRVGGNAIVPEAAAEVIAAFMDEYGVPCQIGRAA